MGRNGKMMWDLASKLRFSQGFYSRLYARLAELTEEEWEELEEELPQFHNDLDVIFYLEC